ncbi:MAG: hypothetical protein QT00_C0002G0402 [archaeon GW2011_AR5]|nr:MAG: hypothetical protein QT00_C0002G0402 [archaeon GW2011_AR5]
MCMQLVNNMEMDEINRLLDEINEDRTVPRNIRNLVQEAKNNLNGKQELPVRINSAISILDEVSNDSNIPIYSRTQIWNIVSMLEVMNERAKV